MPDDTAPVPPSRLERCPNCDSKLPDTPVSICPYCVYPLGTEKAKTASGAESPNRARILRIAEQEKYPAAQEIQPPENQEFQRGGIAIFWGKTCLYLSPIVIGLGWILGAPSPLTHWITWLGFVDLLLGAGLILRGTAARKRAVALPMLMRPALILDRRSDTQIKGWGGFTVYYFELEFEDGTRAEFRYPGRGSSAEPYVNNLPGLAFTRGEDLLLFKHIRV